MPELTLAANISTNQQELPQPLEGLSYLLSVHKQAEKILPSMNTKRHIKIKIGLLNVRNFWRLMNVFLQHPQ